MFADIKKQIEQAREQAREQGREKGRLEMMAELVSDGLISFPEATKYLSITEVAELKKKIHW